MKKKTTSMKARSRIPAAEIAEDLEANRRNALLAIAASPNGLSSKEVAKAIGHEYVNHVGKIVGSRRTTVQSKSGYSTNLVARDLVHINKHGKYIYKATDLGRKAAWILQDSHPWLNSDEAAEDGPTEDGNYDLQDGDYRKLVDRQIRERRGQQQFREALRRRYGDRCVITGCELLHVLEAAHIRPYRGENDNHPENGLLLRSDIHTLFDLDLLGIAPETLRVELHPDVAAEYEEFDGHPLDCPSGKPSHEALRQRYEEFCQRLKEPAA